MTETYENLVRTAVDVAGDALTEMSDPSRPVLSVGQSRRIRSGYGTATQFPFNKTGW